MDWPNFLRGIVYSFLSEQYWRSWRPSSIVVFARSAVVSGLLEFAGCLVLQVCGCLHFLFIRTHQLSGVAEANQGTELYALVLLSIEYVFQPLTLVGTYLVGEGALRSWAAYFTDEVMPSVPLKLVVFTQEWLRARKERPGLWGPAIPDLFEHVRDVACDVQISCPLPKEGWRVSTAVAIDDYLYEIVTLGRSFICCGTFRKAAWCGDCTGMIRLSNR